MSSEPLRGLVSISGIADQAVVSENTVRNWISGKGAHKPFPDPEGSIGNVIVYDHDEVAEWLSGRTRNTDKRQSIAQLERRIALLQAQLKEEE